MKTILGTWTWWLGERIIAQGAHYEGDTLESVRDRARASLEMLNRDNLPYFSHATPKFYKLGE